MGYICALFMIPMVAMTLVFAFHGKWSWSIPMGVLWLGWIIVQSRIILRRNKICREIVDQGESLAKWSNRFGRMLKISRWELICLLSIVFSFFTFIPSSLFFRECRELRRDYEKEIGGEKGMDIENELSRKPKMSYRRGL